MKRFNIKRSLRIVKIYFHGHFSLIKKVKVRRGKEFVAGIQFLTQPNYYSELVQKYGNDDFTWWLTELDKFPIENRRKFHFFENGSLVERTEPREPVTITITKDNYGGTEGV